MNKLRKRGARIKYLTRNFCEQLKIASTDSLNLSRHDLVTHDDDLPHFSFVSYFFMYELVSAMQLSLANEGTVKIFFSEKSQISIKMFRDQISWFFEIRISISFYLCMLCYVQFVNEIKSVIISVYWKEFVELHFENWVGMIELWIQGIYNPDINMFHKALWMLSRSWSIWVLQNFPWWQFYLNDYVLSPPFPIILTEITQGCHK